MYRKCRELSVTDYESFAHSSHETARFCALDFNVRVFFTLPIDLAFHHLILLLLARAFVVCESNTLFLLRHELIGHTKLAKKSDFAFSHRILSANSILISLPGNYTYRFVTHSGQHGGVLFEFQSLLETAGQWWEKSVYENDVMKRFKVTSHSLCNTRSIGFRKRHSNLAAGAGALFLCLFSVVCDSFLLFSFGWNK